MRGASMAHNAPFDYVSREVLEVYTQRFVAPHERRDPLAAPVHADLRGLPPMLVLAGGAEVLLDDARAIAARAREAGVDVRLEIEADMIHAWPLFSGMPSAQRAVERMGLYVRARLEGGDRPVQRAQRNPIP
jgi:acetyl esterase/lipase